MYRNFRGRMGGGMRASKHERPRTPPSLNEIRRLLRYLRPHRRKMVVATAALIAGSSFGLVFPWIMQNLVDAVLARSDMAQLNRITLLLIVTFLLRSVFQ